MKNQFFEDILGLAPQQMIDSTGAMRWGDFADRESVDSAGSNIESEVITFRSYLEERQPQDRVRILEYTTGELLTAYYAVRRAMKGLTNTEKDEGRPSMRVIYMAIAFLTTCAERDLKLEYSKEFLASWTSRGDHILASMLEEMEKRENTVKEADALVKEFGISKTANEPPKTFDKAVLDAKLKYNKDLIRYYEQEDYIEDYLKDIYDAMDPKSKKQNLGAVCFLLYEAGIFKVRKFSDLLKLLADYWGVELPKDRRPNKYKKAAEDFKIKYPKVITPY